MNTIIKVLGTGCSKCKITTQIISEVVAQYNIEATIEKVEDIMEIMEYNVLATPAVIVNDKLVLFGRVPEKQEVLEFLTPSDGNKETNNGSCCSGTSCC